ncbi:hypothetical protein [Acidicapsa acidisoli]|uniref:hypothetical protein n=1 Tax=Acidicapsa acidisoli TaxID=1615681 RepID=UPI0021E03479|nr:hypothetical protein [Acidicapsa acidisoli]
MCPVCISAAALIAASLTTSGGLAAIAIRKFSVRNVETSNPAQTSSKESHHG